jgi:hypothetical protein
MQHLDAHILLATASPRTGANTAVPPAPMQKESRNWLANASILRAKAKV